MTIQELFKISEQEILYKKDEIKEMNLRHEEISFFTFSPDKILAVIDEMAKFAYPNTMHVYVDNDFLERVKYFLFSGIHQCYVEESNQRLYLPFYYWNNTEMIYTENELNQFIGDLGNVDTVFAITKNDKQEVDDRLVPFQMKDFFYYEKYLNDHDVVRIVEIEPQIDIERE